MDKIDRKLLKLLQEDASRTNAELAAEVGLSPSSCLRRIRRLHDTGVIDRVVAVLNPAKAGNRNSKPHHFRKFSRQIVLICHLGCEANF